MSLDFANDVDSPKDVAAEPVSEGWRSASWARGHVAVGSWPGLHSGPSARELEAVRGPAIMGVAFGRDWLLIVLRGHIDLFNVDSIRAGIERHAPAGNGRVVLDLAAVELLDPIALKVLLAARQRLGWNDLIVVAPSPAIRLTLESSGLDKIVAVHESLNSVASGLPLEAPVARRP